MGGVKIRHSKKIIKQIYYIFGHQNKSAVKFKFCQSIIFNIISKRAHYFYSRFKRRRRRFAVYFEHREANVIFECVNQIYHKRCPGNKPQAVSNLPNGHL